MLSAQGLALAVDSTEVVFAEEIAVAVARKPVVVLDTADSTALVARALAKVAAAEVPDHLEVFAVGTLAAVVVDLGT